MIGFPPRYSTSCTLNNRTPAGQLVILWLAFEKAGWNISEINPANITAFTHFSFRSWSEQISATLTPGNIRLSSVSTGAQVLDFGRNRQNIRRLQQTIATINETYSNEALDVIYAEREQRIGVKTDTIHLTPERQGFLNIFKPARGFFITPILIVLNVLIYLVLTNKMLFAGSSWWQADVTVLEQAGANFKPLTLFGQPWRLLAASFLHADVMHLFFNLYGIMIGGTYLEPLLGRWRFLAVYLLCALAASIASLWWYDITPTLGASGAVFGLLGFIFTLLLRKFVEPFERRALLISIGIYLAFSLATIFMQTNFDHGAHIGGLLMGILLCLLLFRGLKTPATSKNTLPATALAATVLVIAYFLLPRDVNTYIKKLQQLDENFILSYGVYNTRSEDEKVKWLKNYSIYYMDQNLRIMDEIDQLSLGVDSRKRNVLLRRLVETQKNVFNYNYRTLVEGKNSYDHQILEALRELDEMQKALSR
ncbi:rhomboid family intramembrane serine protease [Chitinophaga lutea]|uniref:Rhomboid family intramembrane serine protease n=1 Tax=Chitinophaga lutea TaxID=2488634 RepID=A0A3N4Q0K0_9BACT|nr:rhomboid family intramembrane serine protease [Chitinophaga lutea]RPE13738.1 rhomboid family intramembrane serine protease [Chitinophaga lutea]